MNKFFIVFFHTYKKHIVSRAFVVSTLITLGLIYALSTTGRATSEAEKQNIKTVGFIGETSIENRLQNELVKNESATKLIKYKDEKQAKDDANWGKINAYVLVKPQTFETNYFAKELVDQQLMRDLQTGMNSIKKEETYKQLSLSKKDTDRINENVTFIKTPLGEKAKSEDEINQSLIIVFALLFIIYATVVFYGSAIAYEVASEKSSRIMEILITSVSPITQMFGKILGVALVGITQYVIFFIGGRFSFYHTTINLSKVPKETFIYAFIFFLLGYFLYASILATLGSIVNRIEDIHQTISPINVLVIIGFVLSIFGLVDPTTKLTTITSFIPFFSPMIMFLRIAILDVPQWQILLSIGILVISIIIFSIIGAKVYKGGVLLYGKTSFKNLKRAFSVHKK
jgi:ABC-2 type transport system permease protein